MKNLIFTFSLLLSISCSESYLNEPKPTSQVSPEVVFHSRAGVEAFISGILRKTRSAGFVYNGIINHDKGGLYSIYLARSVKGSDAIVGTNSRWYSYDYAFQQSRGARDTRPDFSWEFPYYVLNQINALIQGINESNNLPEADKMQLAAQGYALRGFYYFQLAMEFQLTYAKDPKAPAPPIYTKPARKGNPMSTLKQLYALIVSDLKKAVAGLDASRLGKSYVNKHVAEGILARVYQVMGKWPEAEKMAHNAYGGDVSAALDATSYGAGFNNISNKEWIWGMPQTSSQTIYFLNPASFSDHEKGGYKNIYIDSAFVSKFSETDVRKLFPESDKAPVAWQKYTTTKFKFSFDADMVLMRTSEMILIEAEAKYWQGDQAGAHDLLYKLQKNRDPQAKKSSNTGSALLEELLLERRKELYLEPPGVEWYDARRLQRGIKRDDNHRVKVDLAPNDKRFYLEIPQDEIDNNPEIDASVNANR